MGGEKKRARKVEQKRLEKEETNSQKLLHICQSKAKTKPTAGDKTRLTAVWRGDDVELNVLGCRVDILGGTNCDQCV